MRSISACILVALLLFAATSCGQEAPEVPETPATMGQTLLQSFQRLYEEDPQRDLESLGQQILAEETVGFQGSTAPVEPGALMGFGSTAIEGFSQGVMFAPVISTIPFVGYLFRLAPDTDADAFVQTLKDAADLRWNICTQADEVVVDRQDDVVFFLMCPRSMDAEPAQDGEALPPETPLPPEDPTQTPEDPTQTPEQPATP